MIIPDSEKFMICFDCVKQTPSVRRHGNRFLDLSHRLRHHGAHLWEFGKKAD